MSKPFVFHKSWLNRIFIITKPDFTKLYLLPKRKIALTLFYIGMAFACFASLTPWFLWAVHRYFLVIACLPLGFSLLISSSLKNGLYTRKDYFIPLFFVGILLWMMAITSGRNVNGIIMVFFNLFVFYALFKIEKPYLHSLIDIMSTLMACLLLVSIPYYILYLIGIPLPHVRINGYERIFDNYFLFIVDDRFNFELIPRFHSVFLEPAQLGMACITLLYAQIGRWNKWSCRILFFAILISFSLAAYLCLIVLFFSASWMKGRAVWSKILVIGSLALTIGFSSVFYNKGENMINQLIVSRLMFNEDGEMEGNNRNSKIFIKEFEQFATTGDVIFGRGLDEMQRFQVSGSQGGGNSGYRVFIYCYGLVCTFLYLIVLCALVRTSENRRAILSMLVLHALSFWAHGIPLRLYFFVPMYVLLYSQVYPPSISQKNRINEALE